MFFNARSSFRTYSGTPESVLIDRMHYFLERLRMGFAIDVDLFFVEEVRWLRDEFGDRLILSRGKIWLMED